MGIALDFLLISGIILTIIMLYFIVQSKQQKNTPQKLLMAVFLIMLCNFLYHYAAAHSINWLRIITFNFNGATTLFLGAVIFLYIKSLFDPRSKKNAIYILHFTPSIIFVLFISTPILISLQSGEMLFAYLDFIASHRRGMFNLFDIIFMTYSITAFIDFQKYKAAIRKQYADLTEKDIDWIAKLLIGAIVISSGHFIVGVYSNFIGFDAFEPKLFTISSMIMLVTYLGYHGTHQSRLLIPYFLLEKPTVNKTTTNSQLEAADIELIQNRLEKLLKTDKVYLNPKLSLNELADLIPCTDKKLSEFINQQLNNTFYELVNGYRVEAVKAMMQSTDYDHLTLLGLAYEAGFNSKTSFNRIFKNLTGLSPSVYKNSLK